MENRRLKHKKSKRLKLGSVTKFEDLPNELHLQYIFPSFDLYSLYHTFYGINTRYNQLVASCQRLQLNMENVPASKSVSFIYHAGNIFPQGSVVSLKNANDNQIGFLSEDYLFENLAGKLKSITLNGVVSIRHIYQLFQSVE